jgi:sulfur carrier protein ThiS
MGTVLVRLRNPSRTETVPGPVLVSVLLERLDLNRESVLVIRNRELVPGDTMLDDGDEIEIRPVISGGAS